MIIDMKNTTIRLKAGGAMEFIDVKMGNGTLTYTEKVNREYIKDRGLLDTVRDGDEEPMDVSLNAQWDHITAASGDSAPTISDVFKHTGLASGWISASADLCEPFCVDILILDVPKCVETDETLTLHEFRYEQLQMDLKAGTIAVTGKCNTTRASALRAEIGS